MGGRGSPGHAIVRRLAALLSLIFLSVSTVASVSGAQRNDHQRVAVTAPGRVQIHTGATVLLRVTDERSSSIVGAPVTVAVGSAEMNGAVRILDRFEMNALYRVPVRWRHGPTGRSSIERGSEALFGYGVRGSIGPSYNRLEIDLHGTSDGAVGCRSRIARIRDPMYHSFGVAFETDYPLRSGAVTVAFPLQTALVPNDRTSLSVELNPFVSDIGSSPTYSVSLTASVRWTWKRAFGGFATFFGSAGAPSGTAVTGGYRWNVP